MEAITKRSFLPALILFSFFMAGEAHAMDAVMFDVPHITQAPTGNWKDPRFADGCEETSLIMAMAWVRGEGIRRAEAAREILAMAALENEMYGFHQDTSISDTAKLMKAYYGLEPEVRTNIGIEDIKQALYQKQLPIVAINGSPLRLYRRAPPRHMVVVTGFDPASNTFFINDPLINKKDIAIPASRLQTALRDYPSGVHKAVKAKTTAMLLVSWPWQ
jgi:uncharacterized protein YvpB